MIGDNKMTEFLTALFYGFVGIIGLCVGGYIVSLIKDNDD
jgi:hypothetical protein